MNEKQQEQQYINYTLEIIGWLVIKHNVDFDVAVSWPQDKFDHIAMAYMMQGKSSEAAADRIFEKYLKGESS